MARAWPCSAFSLLLLLGCPSDDVPIGEASSGHGSGSSGVATSSSESATGMLPPSTSTGPGTADGADTSSGTTLATTGSTTRDDFGASEDDVSCLQCCGNEVINDGEECDCGLGPCTPEGLDFAECAGLVNQVFPDRVYTGGILDCSPASCQFVFTTCTFCGDGFINGNETCEPDPPPQDTCASLGLGDATEPLPCGESCQLDTSTCG